MTTPTSPRARPRSLAVFWLLGTLAAITVSVIAVSLAGDQVTSRHPSPLSSAQVADAVSQESPTTDDRGSSGTEPGDDHGTDVSVDDHPGSASESEVGSPGSSGSSGSSESSGGSPSPSSTISGGGSGGSGPGSGHSGSGGEGSGSDGPSDGEHAGTTAPPAPATFAKSTDGGSVTVRCSGSTVTLVSAKPAAGWTQDVRNSGPEEVEVRFEGHDRDTEVKARCSSSLVSWSS